MNNLIDKSIDTFVQTYFIPVSLVLLFVLLILVYTIFRQRGMLKIQAKTCIEHEEKIKFLRQTHLEYQYKQSQKEHLSEKKVLELEHTIQNLEEKINDGTKNQVVAKLEAYKNKREKQLNRVNLG